LKSFLFLFLLTTWIKAEESYLKPNHEMHESSFGVVNVSRTARLDGNLENGYQPPSGTSFDLLNATAKWELRQAACSRLSRLPICTSGVSAGRREKPFSGTRTGTVARAGGSR
jgi:hypothetical protein